MAWTAYIVGGAVRDRLLGLPTQDRDWVVVGATPEALLAAGFTPVGKDFPVFLHPHSHEEYALARTERKTAPGYKGFVFHTDPGVRLEDDLVRRDLTINAMALGETGEVVDPFGGQRDLAARLFRHVSPAFAEDPVRILRVARFAARFVDFTVAPETMALMQQMVDAGEVDHLVPERVWQEVSRALGYAQPARTLQVLHDCGALARILPELEALFSAPAAPALAALDLAARQDQALPVRWAVLWQGIAPELVEARCEQLKVPVEFRELARLLAREHAPICRAHELDAPALVSLLERVDALRRPERWAQLLAACACLIQTTGQAAESRCTRRLQRAYTAFTALDAGAIAKSQTDKAGIPAAIHAARVAAVQAALTSDAQDAPSPQDRKGA